MDRVRNLLEQIRNRLEELNKAEKKVAEVILLNPQQATRFSIAALAQAASVSEPPSTASAVRLVSAVTLNLNYSWRKAWPAVRRMSVAQWRPMITPRPTPRRSSAAPSPPWTAPARPSTRT